MATRRSLFTFSLLFVLLSIARSEESPPVRLLKAVLNNDPVEINATLIEHHDVVHANLKYKGEPVIVRAVESGFYDATQALLQHRASLDSKNQKGEDILYLAADKAYVAIAQLILGNRNNIMGPKVNGYSAFHRACMGTTKKHSWTVEMFLDHGISPYDPTDDGLEPLDLAATPKSKELIQDKINLLEYFGARARGEL